MAMNFDDLIIDRCLEGVFLNSEGKIIGAVNHLQDASIETTSETKDKTDENGVLIKRFFTAKNVEFSAENTVFSTSLAALTFGSDRIFAKSEGSNHIIMPKMFKIDPTKVETDDDDKKVYKINSKIVDGSIIMNGCTNTGLPDATKEYARGTEASATEFAYTVELEGADYVTKITLPTGVTETLQIVAKAYVTEGMMLEQTADKFPKTCEFLLAVLVCDPCNADVLRKMYIDFPSFQMSPDNTLSLTTDATQSFSGTAQKDYCKTAGTLYTIYEPAEDLED